LDMTEEEAQKFANAILEAKTQIKTCEVCCDISENSVCGICSDSRRDSSIICVVESSKDVAAFEKIKEYNGFYHVLGGLISPIDGIGPENLHINELIKRLDDGVQEIIIATNPSVEGETTAMYISRLVKPFGVKVSRLAYGLPVGSELEYADELTLFKALEGRREI